MNAHSDPQPGPEWQFQEYTPHIEGAWEGPVLPGGKGPPEVQPWEDHPNFALGLDSLISEESVFRAQGE